MVIQHKCPCCGADMVFHAEKGLLYCESCENSISVDRMENRTKTESYEEFVRQTQKNTFQAEEAQQYQCKNCGAVLITDADTTATSCGYCGAPMILGDRLSGDLAPSKVIPFQISKEQAQTAFKKWCKRSLFMPTKFKSADRLKSMTGMYVPFWLYDLNTQGTVYADCTKRESYRQGKYRIEKTHYYDVYRDVDLNFLKVPADASKKMDDKVMDLLEPYDYSQLRDFNTPYLSGYLAEKYNYTDEEMFPRVQKRAADDTMSYIKSTLREYSSVKYKNQKISIWPKDVHYALLPVWMLCFDYENTERNFIMNGQTGKIIGKPPISKGKVVKWYFIFALIIYVILMLTNVT